MDLLKSKLNMCGAIVNKDKKRASNRKWGSTKIDCVCGGKTDKSHKSHHEKTQQHQKYLNTNKNITINITKLIIIQK